MITSTLALRVGGFLLLTSRIAYAGPVAFTHLGCQTDAANRTLDGGQASLGANGNSPTNCIQACSNLGFPLAGVENGEYVCSFDET
jgi:hypothetical protein